MHLCDACIGNRTSPNYGSIKFHELWFRKVLRQAENLKSSKGYGPRRTVQADVG